jgi:hypothetical protein
MPTEPGGPSATVAAALRALGVPLLVTTADNALLETAWLSEFLAAIPAEVDLAAALARRDAVEAPHPTPAHLAALCRRRPFRLQPVPAGAAGGGERDRLLADPRGRAQAPAAHGAPPRLDLRRALRPRPLSMAAAAARLGELAGGGARFAIVALRDGRAAIDVDKPDDLDLVRRLVAAAPRAPA